MNIQTLLASYGSPAYVYDLQEVRHAYQSLRASIPEVCLLYYSLKANPHPTLVKELVSLGCRTEICSRGELQSVLAAGCNIEHCLYTGPGKTLSDISFALTHGVSYFSVDSPTDLDKVATAAETLKKEANILLRVNPGDTASGMGLAMAGLPSQFGADADWIKKDPRAFVGNRWTRLTGFHIYMGTNLTTSTSLLQMFEVASKTARELADILQFEPAIVDLGGGFGQPFATGEPPYDFSDLQLPLRHMLDQDWPNWREGKPSIAFESGRFLIGRSGTLFCTVQDVKFSRGFPFVILDSGVNHLGGMAGLRRVPRMHVELSHVEEIETQDILHDVCVVGPLCAPVDYLNRGIDLPGMAPGQILAIRNVGAYGLTGSLIGFLSHDAPVEIVLDGEELKEVSQLRIVRDLKKGV